MRFTYVARPYTSGQAIIRIVGAGNQFIHLVKWLGDDDRAKNFFADDAHVRFGIFDDRGRDEIAAIAGLRSAGHITSALLLALVHIAGDAR